MSIAAASFCKTPKSAGRQARLWLSDCQNDATRHRRQHVAAPYSRTIRKRESFCDHLPSTGVAAQE
jgi:hypothetical protein